MCAIKNMLGDILPYLNENAWVLDTLYLREGTDPKIVPDVQLPAGKMPLKPEDPINRQWVTAIMKLDPKDFKGRNLIMAHIDVKCMWALDCCDANGQAARHISSMTFMSISEVGHLPNIKVLMLHLFVVSRNLLPPHLWTTWVSTKDYETVVEKLLPTQKKIDAR